jgi:deoxyribose-phosphate aldolase
MLDASGGFPVKVILECHHLSEDEIRAGCHCAIQAGAAEHHADTPPAHL